MVPGANVAPFTLLGAAEARPASQFFNTATFERRSIGTNGLHRVVLQCTAITQMSPECMHEENLRSILRAMMMISGDRGAAPVLSYKHTTTTVTVNSNTGTNTSVKTPI